MCFLYSLFLLEWMNDIQWTSCYTISVLNLEICPCIKCIQCPCKIPGLRHWKSWSLWHKFNFFYKKGEQFLLPQKSIWMLALSPSTLSILTEREIVSLLPGQKALIDCHFTKRGPGEILVMIELHMHRPVGVSKLLKASADTSGTAAVASSLPLLPIQVPRHAALTACA